MRTPSSAHWPLEHATEALGLLAATFPRSQFSVCISNRNRRSEVVPFEETFSKYRQGIDEAPGGPLLVIPRPKSPSHLPSRPIASDSPPKVIFILGRWQPCHRGHVLFFQRLLEADPRLCQTPRDTQRLASFSGAQLVIGVASFSHQNASNPWSVASRRQLIQWAIRQAAPAYLHRVTVEHFEVTGGPAAEAVGLHAKVFGQISDRLYVTGNPNTAEAYKAAGLPHLQVDCRTTSGTEVRRLLVAAEYDEVQRHLLPGQLEYMQDTGMVDTMLNIAAGG